VPLERIDNWSLTIMAQRLIKAGGHSDLHPRHSNQITHRLVWKHSMVDEALLWVPAAWNLVLPGGDPAKKRRLRRTDI